MTCTAGFKYSAAPIAPQWVLLVATWHVLDGIPDASQPPFEGLWAMLGKARTPTPCGVPAAE